LSAAEWFSFAIWANFARKIADIPVVFLARSQVLRFGGQTHFWGKIFVYIICSNKKISENNKIWGVTKEIWGALPPNAPVATGLLCSPTQSEHRSLPLQFFQTCLNRLHLKNIINGFGMCCLTLNRI